MKSTVGRKNNINYGLDDLSGRESSDSESDSEVPKTRKKKAVNEYKAAINCFGSKSSIGMPSCETSKKAVDKVIVSEAEYNTNVNDWLINDLDKKTGSNKRKLKENYNDISIDDDLTNLTFEDAHENENIIIDDENDYINDILEHNSKSKKSLNKKYKNLTTSPISKRRNIDTVGYNSEVSSKHDIFEENDSQSSTSSFVLSNFNRISDSKPKKAKDNLKLNEILIDSDNDENFPNKENGLKIKSPFKKNKTQMKLTKMLNYNNSKQMTAKEQAAPVQITESVKTEKLKPTTEVSQTNWKIKATIDNRHFLIPVS